VDASFDGSASSRAGFSRSHSTPHARTQDKAAGAPMSPQSLRSLRIHACSYLWFWSDLRDCIVAWIFLPFFQNSLTRKTVHNMHWSRHRRSWNNAVVPDSSMKQRLPSRRDEAPRALLVVSRNDEFNWRSAPSILASPECLSPAYRSTSPRDTGSSATNRH